MKPALLLTMIATFWMAPASAQDLFPADAFADYTPDTANGERVFHSAGCAACHAIDGDDTILAGGMELQTSLGTLYAPNITPHRRQGIGAWGRADFLNAILRGHAPDGRRYFGAVFPFPAYARMRPEDALDLWAYLGSLPGSDAPSRPHRMNLIDQFVLNFWSSERAPLTGNPHTQLARGEYLVEALGHCGECHSGRAGVLSARLDPGRPFTGETGMLGEYAGAINVARLTREGTRPEDFVNGALVDGLLLNGLPMTSTTMRRIARGTARLPHEDRVAIYAYLIGAPVDPESVERHASVQVAQAAEVAPEETVGAATTAPPPEATAAPPAEIVEAAPEPAPEPAPELASDAEPAPAAAAPVPVAATAVPVVADTALDAPEPAPVAPEPAPIVAETARPPAPDPAPIVQTSAPQSASAPVPPPADLVPDWTGATALIQRVAAHCDVPAAPVPVSVSVSVSVSVPVAPAPAPVPAPAPEPVAATAPSAAEPRPEPASAPQARPEPEPVPEPVAASVPAAAPEPVPAPTLAPAPAPAPAPPAVDPALEAAADEVLERHCRTCHGRGMTNQRSFFTGSMAELARDRGAVIPGDHRASLLYDSIATNRMPTGRLPRVTGAELQVLVAWIDQLAPVPAPAPARASLTRSASLTDGAEAPPSPLPLFVGGAFPDLMLAAVRDLGEIDERDRAFARYFSFAAVPLPEVDCGQPGALRNPVHYLHGALNKFVNSVSRAQTLRAVDPVAGTDGALVRIDLRDFGWTAQDWDALTTAAFTPGAAEAGYTETTWRDLAPVYPFAVDPGSDAMLGVLAGFTGAEVPVLSADWFARFASESPFYDLLLRLPDTIDRLEARMGIDVNQAIRDLRVVRAGFTAEQSGVSDHNRMLERFDLPRGGYYWRSYDFAGSEGRQSLVLHPDGPAELGATPSGTAPFLHDGGEMIFSLPNGMQGYYLSQADGRRLSEGPTEIVSFRARPVGRGIEVVNARSCFTCHDNGIIPKRDEIRAFIQASAAFDFRQRETLLRMYPEQSVVDGLYRRDIETFLAALQRLNVTQPSVAGLPVSLIAPDGGGEIVTWLADHQFRRLDEPGLARLFHLTPDELRARARHLGDPVLTQVLNGWLYRFDTGLSVTIDEAAEFWPALLPRLTGLHPRAGRGWAAPVAGYEAAAAAAVQQTVQGAYTAFAPDPGLAAYVPPAVPADPLTLRLHVPYQQVRVNELLSFEVEANRACTLQIVYVEANQRVVVFPQAVLGEALLRPGERRRIPQAASGLQLRFDRPGSGEALLAYCREPGSTQPPMVAEQLVQAARARYQPLTRGLEIEAGARVQNDAGQSAFASVTFDVRAQ